MATRNTLKGWFIRRAKPTQSQFGSWIDSFFHLTEDTLPIAKVDGLQTALEALQLQINTAPGASNYIQFVGTEPPLIPAGAYDKIRIQDTNGLVINIGYAPGGVDIAEGMVIENGFASMNQDLYFPEDTLIYIDGITIDAIIQLRK